jgi:hypothetical protein
MPTLFIQKQSKPMTINDDTALLQEERFKLIDFLLFFKGRLMRSELVEVLNIGTATASRCIKAFLKSNPSKARYLSPRHGYIADTTYLPKYQHDALMALQYLAYSETTSRFHVESFGIPRYSFHPVMNPDVVAPITRAIVTGTDIVMSYTSTRSGRSMKIVKPHSVFESSGLWYFRAFDREPAEFRTFRFSRVVESCQIESAAADVKALDDEWNRKRTVTVLPHPKNPNPMAQILDLGMSEDGSRVLNIPEALLGFALTDLRVDCSAGSKLDFREYPLALSSRDELMTVDSMALAPGFNS